MQKGSRARRRATYKYQVTMYTNRAKTNLGARPYGYQIDHIVPKEFGFNHDIPPELIGSIDNIEWLPANENIGKGTRITADSIRVLRLWNLDDLADVYEARVSI